MAREEPATIPVLPRRFLLSINYSFVYWSGSSIKTFFLIQFFCSFFVNNGQKKL